MTAPAPTTFAAVLRAELTRRCARNSSYSLRAFARSLDVDHATLSQLLRGRRGLTRDTILRLGAASRAGGGAPRGLRPRCRGGARRPPAYSPSLARSAIVGDPLHHQLLALTHTEDFRGESAFPRPGAGHDSRRDQRRPPAAPPLRAAPDDRGPVAGPHRCRGAGPRGLRACGVGSRRARVSAASTEPSVAAGGRRPRLTLCGNSRSSPGIPRRPRCSTSGCSAGRSTSERARGPPGLHRGRGDGWRHLAHAARGEAAGPAVHRRGRSRIDRARAHRLGAQVVVPPQALPGGDALAILVDPEGRRSVCTARARGGDRERDAPRARARGGARGAAHEVRRVQSMTIGAGQGRARLAPRAPAPPGRRRAVDGPDRPRGGCRPSPGAAFRGRLAGTGVASTGSQPTGRTGMDEAMRGIEALRRRDEAAEQGLRREGAG
jgi:hypothetical protein